jgi:hypothetical protein
MVMDFDASLICNTIENLNMYQLKHELLLYLITTLNGTLNWDNYLSHMHVQLYNDHHHILHENVADGFFTK